MNVKLLSKMIYTKYFEKCPMVIHKSNTFHSMTLIKEHLKNLFKEKYIGLSEAMLLISVSHI